MPPRSAVSSIGERVIRDGTLVAVLLNPPGTTSGTLSRNAVERAAEALGYGDLAILNLCATATASVVELNGLWDTVGWMSARRELRAGMRTATGLFGAWGIAGLTGEARQARDEQIQWLYTEALGVGLSHVWMVGGEPRHPSRWHQYVSDKYGRTTGGTFGERLAQVIEAVELPSRASAECDAANLGVQRAPQDLGQCRHAAHADPSEVHGGPG